ncbi:MAG: hypothetical protein P9L99_19160 [Candidatus Lernaella stagnicola]|nr:hypothetical protein [Candidatus Lernaella stagnicola]
MLVFAFFCRFVAGQIGVDALGDTDAAWRAVFPALFIIACDDVGIWDEIVSLTGLTTLARLTLVLCFGKDLLG